MMNKQVLVNYSQKLLLALVTVSSVGLVTAPAQADNALIQESVQESVTTGRGNVSIQNSNQSHQQYTEYRDLRDYGRYGYRQASPTDLSDSESTGIVQRSNQFCDQVGEYNTCVQDAEQSSLNNTRRVRRSRF